MHSRLSLSPRKTPPRPPTFVRAQGNRASSFGDRACLALAARFEVPAVTADRSWNDLPEIGVAVRLIR